MNNFSSNIKFLRKRRHRTQDDVSQALGMKRSTLSGYENSIAQPGMDALVAFSNYFNVAVDTLIKVDLTALSESQLSQLERGYDVFITGSKLRVLATTVDNSNEENIELINEKAKAGYSRGFADPDYIKVLPTFHLPFLSKEKKYRTFQVSGDSMLPVADGDYVTGAFVQNWLHVKDGTPCIILTLNEGIVFKIIENNLKDNKSLQLISLNPLYKPYSIAASEIKEVWKFVHYISNEIPNENVFKEPLSSTVKELQQQVRAIQTRLNI